MAFLNLPRLFVQVFLVHALQLRGRLYTFYRRQVAPTLATRVRLLVAQWGLLAIYCSFVCRPSAPGGFPLSLFAQLPASTPFLWLLADGVANIAGAVVERWSVPWARTIVSWILAIGTTASAAPMVVAFRDESWEAALSSLFPLLLLMRLVHENRSFWNWLEDKHKPLRLEPAPDEEVREGICPICRD
jgi:hypothetical protein